MRRFWHSKAVRALLVVLVLSFCLLIHLEYRVESLLKEAEEAKDTFELDRRERDPQSASKLKRQHTLEEFKDTGGGHEDVMQRPSNEGMITGKTLKADQIVEKKSMDLPTTTDSPLSVMQSRYKYTHKIKNGVREFWWHLRARLRKMQKDKKLDDVEDLLKDLSHQEKSIVSDLEGLEGMDQEWKDRTAGELKETIQRRLHRLQNPENCDTARKLVCSMGKACGFGCQMHHVMYCFILAYGTGRTLVLQSGGWSYSRDKGWEGAFLALSSSCTAGPGAARWDSKHASKQVVSVPIVESLNPRPAFLPQAVPREFADRLFAFHGHPFVWFAGQMLSYLMRPNEELQRFINDKKGKMGIKKPYVGIQVRRTDKINTEAAFHGIDEYMVHVEEWYQQYGMTHKIDKKRVFIATDDPSVIKEARQKYSEYEVYGDERVAESAQTVTRYSLTSLFGVAFDVYTLAASEYLVCTFSSQVCRLGYEIMQTLHTNAAAHYYSLDDVYYFGGQQAHEVRALFGHAPRQAGQLTLQEGDVIGIAGNEKDGTSKGKNRRTSVYGEYLSYKVEEVPVVADFHQYRDTDDVV